MSGQTCCMGYSMRIRRFLHAHRAVHAGRWVLRLFRRIEALKHSGVPDGFDESRTLILDPSVFVLNEHEEPSSKSSKKRHLADGIDSCQTTKRPKVSSPPKADKNDDTGDDTLIEPEEVIKDKTTQFISLAFAAPRRRGKFSKAVRKFESCISFAPPKLLVEAPKQNHDTPA
jgi:hypothetical protein